MSEVKKRWEKLRYVSCPSCGKDMGKTYDQEEKYLPECPACGTQTKFSQNKKYEEIKRMAFKLLLATAHRNDKEEVTIFGEIPEIWEFAEEFYNYAKQKQEEANDGDA